MFDRWEHTIPAGTTEDEAVTVECKISPGTLKQLRLFMPSGCKGLVKSRILLGQKPIAPRSHGQYIAGQGFVIDLRDMDEPISENLPVLNWILWNEDIAYGHTPWLSAHWISAEESYDKASYTTLKDFVLILKRLIGVP